MMKSLVWCLTLAILVVAAPIGAQEMTHEEQIAAWLEYLDSIDWVEENQTGLMGRQAEIVVPDGYVFTGKEGTQSLMEAFGNLLSEQELGFMAPRFSERNPEFGWFAVFEFDDTGYVKDDEKADLDPDAMMESMIEGEKQANKRRLEMGYDTLDVTGWAMKPTYNQETNNLEWAVNLRSGSGSNNVNLNTRLLGREGVMKVTLVCDPEMLSATIPAYQALLDNFRYQEGRRYAEYRKGDKIAKYGLTGLIVGGGVAALAKTGLLKKLFKPILIGLAALGVWFRRLFTKRGESD
jgi:uncharacterized membrane-anchored protein